MREVPRRKSSETVQSDANIDAWFSARCSVRQMPRSTVRNSGKAFPTLGLTNSTQLSESTAKRQLRNKPENNVSGVSSDTTGTMCASGCRGDMARKTILHELISSQQEQAVSSYRRTRDGPSGRKNGCKLAYATAVSYKHCSSWSG